MVKVKAKDGVLKLDLGCGDNKKEGFQGIDICKTASTDYVFDLLKFPWPVESNSVDEAFASHFFEHIPAAMRPKFMDELYRVLKPNASCTIIVPDPDSHRAIQDFTHQYPPPCSEGFMYFNRGFREMNKLLHGDYDMKCNFDFTYGWNVDPDTQVRNQEFFQFATKYYRNYATDLIVTVIKRD